MRKYQVRQVTWDAGDGDAPRFEALIEIDDNDLPVMLWNGWLCPLLGLDEVNRLIEWQTKARKDGAELDSLELIQPDEYSPLTLIVNGETEDEDRLEPQVIAGSPFWMPGAFSWTWTFADEEDWNA